MENFTPNYLAILVAALSTFVIGGLWYSPILFVNVWMKELGLTTEKQKSASMLKVMGGSFLLSLFAAYNLSMMFGGKFSFEEGILYGFLTGFGFVSTALGTIYLFEQKTLKLFLINAGYQCVAFTVMGAIIAAWK